MTEKISSLWELSKLPALSSNVVEARFDHRILWKDIYHLPNAENLTDKRLLLYLCGLGDTTCTQVSFEMLERWCLSRKNREGISMVSRILDIMENDTQFFQLQSDREACLEATRLETVFKNKLLLNGLQAEIESVATVKNIKISFAPNDSDDTSQAGPSLQTDSILAQIRQRTTDQINVGNGSTNMDWIDATLSVWEVLGHDAEECPDWKDFVFLFYMSLLQLYRRDTSRVLAYLVLVLVRRYAETSYFGGQVHIYKSRG